MSDSTRPDLFKHEKEHSGAQAMVATPLPRRLVEVLGQTPEQRTMELLAACLAPMFILCTFENNSRVGRTIFTVVVLAAGLFGLLRGWLSLRGLRPLVIALGAVGAAIVLSCISSIDPGYSVSTFLHQHLWYGALMLLIACWAVTPQRQASFLRALAIAGALSAALGIALFFFAERLEQAGLIHEAKDFVYRSQDPAGYTYLRARGTLESYTRSAMVFVFAIPAMLALGVSAVRQRRHGELAVVAAAIAISIVYLALTRSRGAWVAVGISSLLTLVLLRTRWWFAVGAVVLLAAAMLLAPGSRARVLTMVRDAGNPNQLFSGRLDLWRQGIRPISEHPLTGIGYGGNIFLTEAGLERYELVTDRRQPDLHSMYLQTLAETGIVGILAYGFLVFVLLRCAVSALRSADAEDRLPGVAVGLAALLAVLASGTIYYYNEAQVAQILWPTTGLIAAGVAGRSSRAPRQAV